MRKKKLDPETLTPNQQECYELLCDLMGGQHHVNDIYEHGGGIQMPIDGYRLSTFDFSYLTELVFLAHDRSIRAAVINTDLSKLAIVLHKRPAREGRICEYHPTLEQALFAHRKIFPDTN
jgi:hypothetical protein